MVVGQQRSSDALAGVVVVPDRGGHGQDALQDAGQDTGGRAASVASQVELSFEGVED